MKNCSFVRFEVFDSMIKKGQISKYIFVLLFSISCHASSGVLSYIELDPFVNRDGSGVTLDILKLSIKNQKFIN